MDYRAPDKAQIQTFLENGYLLLESCFEAWTPGAMSPTDEASLFALASSLLQNEHIVLKNKNLYIDPPGSKPDKFRSQRGDMTTGLSLFLCLAGASPGLETLEIVAGTNDVLPIKEVIKEQMEDVAWTITKYDSSSLKLFQISLQPGDVLALAAGVFHRKLPNATPSIRQMVELNYIIHHPKQP